MSEEREFAVVFVDVDESKARLCVQSRVAYSAYCALCLRSRRTLCCLFAFLWKTRKKSTSKGAIRPRKSETRKNSNERRPPLPLPSLRLRPSKKKLTSSLSLPLPPQPPNKPKQQRNRAPHRHSPALRSEEEARSPTPRRGPETPASAPALPRSSPAAEFPLGPSPRTGASR